MTGPTIVWGAVADSLGHCHWSGSEGETTSDGRLVARRVDEWSTEPAALYGVSHPAPIEARWCHTERIGRVIAMRRQHGKLFAVAELDDLTADDLAALSDEYGPLRWSSSTRKVGRGPLVVRECSLTPTPASVGLHAVSWYQDGVLRGNMPSVVKADVKRGRDDLNRRSATLDVLEVDDCPTPSSYGRAGGEYRNNPREIHYSGGGYVVAVNGRPVGRD